MPQHLVIIRHRQSTLHSLTGDYCCKQTRQVCLAKEDILRETFGKGNVVGGHLKTEKENIWLLTPDSIDVCKH